MIRITGTIDWKLDCGIELDFFYTAILYGASEHMADEVELELETEDIADDTWQTEQAAIESAALNNAYNKFTDEY